MNQVSLMRRRRQYQRGHWIFFLALVASSVAHLLVGFELRPWLSAWLNNRATAEAAETPVQVVRLAPKVFESSLEKARKFANRTRVERPKPKRKPPEKQKRGQIVEVPSQNRKRPKKADFLALEDSSVEKETRARARDDRLAKITNTLQRKTSETRQSNQVESTKKTDRRAAPQRRAGQAERGQGRSAAQRKRVGARSNQRSPSPSPSKRSRKRRSEIKLPDVGTQNIRRLPVPAPNTSPPPLPGVAGGKIPFSTEGGQAGRRVPGVDRGLPTLEELKPTLGTIARISGTPSDDYIKDVPDGEGNFLNTYSFKYATYFYRIRDGVGHHWKRNLRELFRRDPTGDIYGSRDLRTVLFVQLDDDGRVDEVQISQSCGHYFVDEIAVNAFKQAERFPNPPKGVIDENGRVTFHFAFTLERARRGPLNLFR
ncbi:MAG: energy transducer TonB [Myxococcales bacterium]|nr:energy transducer TonB [Myxococcales bacterium]